MVNIKPFRGYLYDEQKVGSRDTVISPPWDIIDDALYADLLARSPFNIIRLIAKTADPAEVKKTFDGWRTEGVLAKDGQPGFYHLTHAFSYQGKVFERTGLFALLELEDLKAGKVIPHEYVFEKQMDNRFRLIDACRANFSPIFMLYQDRDGTVDTLARRTPADFTTRLEDDTLTVRRITRPDDIAACAAVLAADRLFIADGHHRYQAALNVYRHDPAPENKYVLVYCSPIDSPALIICPTHRYVEGISLEEKRPQLAEFFDITQADRPESMFTRMEPDGRIRKKFGVWSGDQFHLLSLKDERKLLPRLPGGHADAWKLLDTVILHQFILKEIYGLDEDRKYFYDRNTEAVLAKCRPGANGMAFFLNPVTAEEFRQTVLHGEVMPQKSTFFFPKVPTGIVIHKFGDV